RCRYQPPPADPITAILPAVLLPGFPEIGSSGCLTCVPLSPRQTMRDNERRANPRAERSLDSHLRRLDQALLRRKSHSADSRRNLRTESTISRELLAA